MPSFKMAIAAVLASGALMLMLVQSHAERIVCDGNYQVVNGQALATPYCRDLNLAHVARSYGWTVTDEAIRYSESTKAQACRAIGFDNRVQEVCAPYGINGGGDRFPR
jgi:hypothetical protein